MRFLLGNWGYNENKAISFMVSPLKTTQKQDSMLKEKYRTKIYKTIHSFMFETKKNINFV